MFEDAKLQETYPCLNTYTSVVKKPERDIIGRESEMHSVLAAMLRPELCNVILLAEAGTGKANSVDTILPVADERGYIRLGDVKVGDKVFDENGCPVNVIGVFPQGMLHAYKVVFTDGTSVVCNDEHLWAARTRFQHYDDKSYGVYTLRDMMDYGIVKVGKRSNKKDMNLKSWYVPRNKAVKRSMVDLPIPPYTMGALIGDGCLTCKRAFTFSSNDEFVVAKVADGIGAVGYKKSKCNYSWQFIAPDDCVGRSDKIYMSYEDVATKMTNDNSVFGEKSIERRIPKIYMFASESQRMELLQGLMDTDGTVTGTDGRINASFSTNSQGLAKDVQELANSLGYRATLCQRKRSEKRKNDEYSVYFMVEDEETMNLFSLPRHIEWIEKHIRHDKKFHKIYNDVAIAEVKDLHRDEEMLCIYVDSPTHLFQITENYIVTHNTALVQGIAQRDDARLYLEVDVAKMTGEDPTELAHNLKQLFDETGRFRKDEDKELVLFIDEFHQIVQSSPMAVEALKPLLADSGTRGVRVIAATTYIEFNDYVKPNQPLMERLQRINLSEPNEDVTVNILKNMAVKYDVMSDIRNESLFHQIYQYTQRFNPAASQPRKSIIIFDAMIGWHRLSHEPLDSTLLAKVLYESYGVNVAFNVDATTIKQELDKVVLSQQKVTEVISDQLQACVADMNNPEKPMSSFLFAGSTGTGKGLTDDTVIPVWTKDGSVTQKLNGDLKVGDYVFNRKGEPVKVTGVYHRGMQDIYKVTLTDGRCLYTDSSHLWTYMSRKGQQTANTYTNSTKELYERGVFIQNSDGRRNLKYWIPMNEAVQYPEADLSVHPYVMGAFLGDGSLTVSQLTLSSADEDLVAHVAELLGGCTYKHNRRNYNWTFPLYNPIGRIKSKQTSIVFEKYPEVCVTAEKKHIPDDYMFASVEQRWQLVKGLFDTDGSICDTNGGRYNVTYHTSSFDLANDVQQLLYSLGVASTVTIARVANNGRYTQYCVYVKSSNENKDRFFWLARKVEIANRAKLKANKETSSRKKDYSWVGIADIELLDEQKPTTCIMVDDEEHLYQAGQYVVTHNTETAKQLAKLLFKDRRALIRFDMSEYVNSNSVDRFKDELTSRIWERPCSILLLDEIEKSCAEVTKILLQVLDDGRLSDRNGKETSFLNCYIICTTNAGSEIYKTIAQYSSDDNGSGIGLQKYDKLIRRSLIQSSNKFPPELVNRFDRVVAFQPLSEETMRDIVRMRLKELRELAMCKHNVQLTIKKKVVDYLVLDKLDTDSDAGGARAITAKINSEILSGVAAHINAYPNHKNITVAVEGEMTNENKNRLESDAHILVTGQL